MQRPGVVRLRNAATVVVTDEFDAAFPAHFGASVSLETQEGDQYTVAVADALGDPENPVSTDQIVEKARTLMAAGGASDGLTDRIVSATLALPQGGPLDDLSAALGCLHHHIHIGTNA